MCWLVCSLATFTPRVRGPCKFAQDKAAWMDEALDYCREYTETELEKFYDNGWTLEALKSYYKGIFDIQDFDDLDTTSAGGGAGPQYPFAAAAASFDILVVGRKKCGLWWKYERTNAR